MLLLKGSWLRAPGNGGDDEVAHLVTMLFKQCYDYDYPDTLSYLSRSLCSELDTLVMYYVHCIVFVFPFFGKYYKRRTQLLLLTKFHISSKDLKLASYCLTYLQEGYGLRNISLFVQINITTILPLVLVYGIHERV